jgi:transcriptional regulator of acetoin/glycerol metabolism
MRELLFPSGNRKLAGLPSHMGKHLKTAAKTTERDTLLTALVATDWNKTKAAGQLKWSRMTLYRKMATYNIVRKTEASQAPLATRTLPS